MDKKALILLSGGLDSVYNLYAAHEKWGSELLALVFNYGQKAFESEYRAARLFADDLKVPLQVINISNLFLSDSSALTSDQKKVPTDQVDIEDLGASQASAKKVWVSNRNGVFLNVGACIAESQNIPWIVPGFNAEEAATFPDNSEEYIDKMNSCLKMSTANGVQIQCFSQKLFKKQILAESLRLGVDLDQLWPCYYNGEEICGKCESCQRFLRAKDQVRGEL